MKTIMIIYLLTFYGSSVTTERTDYDTCRNTKKMLEGRKERHGYDGKVLVDCIFERKTDG